MTVGVLNGIRTGRLPAEVTGFVGRRAELAEVRRLLAGARLVTLTGVGGCGKTRLAIRAATQSRRVFADGVWLVDLASVSDAALLLHEVAETLGLRDQTRRPVLEVVVDFLRDRQLLLVLDNCEHLLDACAEFALAALSGAAGLRLLCTSRQPLGILGEVVWTVPALAYPAPDGKLPADAQVHYPALALFVLRADAASPGFALSADTAPAVAEICHRLDGLPLAIELAASRLRTLSLEQLAAVLRDGFPALMARGAAPAWHRTLESAFEWSYRLCTPAERLAWARLSVFAGSFDPAAAERVCAEDRLPAEQMLDTLAGLVDKSVLIREDHPTGVRYRLLATIREYGLARLRAGGTEAEAALRRRLRDWYLELTARFDAEWFGPDQVAWTQRIQVELPNLRAALDFCLNTEGQLQAGLNLVANLAWYWQAGGQVREATFWFQQVLDADRRPTRARLRALSGYTYSLSALAGDDVVVRARECIALARHLGDADAVACGTRNMANGLMLAGNLTEARPLAEEALAYFAAQPSANFDLAYAKLVLAVAIHFQGDPAGAAPLLADCRDICRRHGDQWWLGHVLIASALVALALGDVAQADGYVRESLPPRHARGDTLGLAGSLERLAWIAALNDDFQRAARLLGAANRQWHLIGQTLYGAPHWLVGRRDCETRARTALGDRAYHIAVQRGAALILDQAIDYALGEPEQVDEPDAGRSAGSTTGPGSTRAAPHTPLTPREWEVAQLIAEGLSNRQIATRLVLSQRTAESHVENILRKLGFTTRTQIATWTVANQHDNN
jgi:predicted ATPase/DNA-binding CsgD family transcriptional regulator